MFGLFSFSLSKQTFTYEEFIELIRKAPVLNVTYPSLSTFIGLNDKLRSDIVLREEYSQHSVLIGKDVEKLTKSYSAALFDYIDNLSINLEISEKEKLCRKKCAKALINYLITLRALCTKNIMLVLDWTLTQKFTPPLKILKISTEFIQSMQETSTLNEIKRSKSSETLLPHLEIFHICLLKYLIKEIRDAMPRIIRNGDLTLIRDTNAYQINLIHSLLKKYLVVLNKFKSELEADLNLVLYSETLYLLTQIDSLLAPKRTEDSQFLSLETSFNSLCKKMADFSNEKAHKKEAESALELDKTVQEKPVLAKYRTRYC